MFKLVNSLGVFKRRGIPADIRARLPYRIIFCVLIVFGALEEVSLVWTFSDVMNGAMAIPNLVGLLGLSYVVYQETIRYFSEEHAD